MTVILNRAYNGLPAANVEMLTPTALETSLIAQGLASAGAAANITTGAKTYNGTQGRVAVAAGSSSVVVTNALVDANTKIWACVAQAAADGTLLRVERIVAAAGSFTIYGTANATATTFIDWAILPPDSFPNA